MKNLKLFLFLAKEFDSGKDGGGGRLGKRHLKQVSAEMTNAKKKKKKKILEKGNQISPAVKVVSVKQLLFGRERGQQRAK